MGLESEHLAAEVDGPVPWQTQQCVPRSPACVHPATHPSEHHPESTVGPFATPTSRLKTCTCTCVSDTCFIFVFLSSSLIDCDFGESRLGHGHSFCDGENAADLRHLLCHACHHDSLLCFPSQVSQRLQTQQPLRVPALLRALA